MNKFGFFQQDQEIFEEVAKNLGLKRLLMNDIPVWCRHPLTYLMEAADDICYRVIDLEDAYKTTHLRYETVEQLFKQIIDDRVDISQADDLEEADRIGYYRAKCIGVLIKDVKDAFLQNYEAIMEGVQDKPLLDVCKSQQVAAELKSTAHKYIYNTDDKIKNELVGFQVIHHILDNFTDAYRDYHGNDLDIHRVKPRTELTFRILPDEKQKNIPNDWYEYFLMINDFISGMSDNYALDLYRNWLGATIVTRSS